MPGGHVARVLSFFTGLGHTHREAVCHIGNHPTVSLQDKEGGNIQCSNNVQYSNIQYNKNKITFILKMNPFSCQKPLLVDTTDGGCYTSHLHAVLIIIIIWLIGTPVSVVKTGPIRPDP